MVRFLALAAGLAFVFVTCGSASVRAADPHSSELWHVATVTDPASKKFTYCAVESSFDNGFSLAFARNRDLNTNIVVTFPNARLPEHTKFHMGLVVDGAAPRDFTGFSASTQTLVIPLQHDRPIMAALQKGKLLELRGPQDAIKFALDGAGDALRQLQQCVDSNLKTETAGGAPQARPQVVIGPLASTEAPTNEMPAYEPPASGNNGMVEPLPLPASPQVASQPAATEPVTSEPTPLLNARPSQAQIKEDDAQAARAAAAKLAETQAAAARQQQADADAARVEAAKQQAVQAQAAQEIAAAQAAKAAQAQQAQQQAQLQASDEAAAKAALAKLQAQQAEAQAQAEQAKQQAAADAAAAQAKQQAEQAAQAQAQAQMEQAKRQAQQQADADAAAKAAQAEQARQQAQQQAAADAAKAAQVKLQAEQAAQAEQARQQAAQLAQQQAAADAAAKAALAQQQAQAKAAAAQIQAQPTGPLPLDQQPVIRRPAQAAQVTPPPPALPPPASPARQPALAALLSQSGVEATRTRPGSYSWKNGPVTGTATEAAARQPFLDAMLDDIDGLEKRCKGPFYSNLGAPVQRGGLTYAEVTTRCGAASSVLLYYQKAGSFGTIAQESGPAAAADAPISTRQRIEAGLN